MKRFLRAFSYFSVLSLLFAVPAHAETCRIAADNIVHTATTELLQEVVNNNPNLQQLDEQELVIEAGKKLIEAPRPDFKARGWMMLLWYGGKQGQEIVAKSAESLQTEEDRAHLYFVMGLFQLTSQQADTAAGGRTLLSQVKDTGKVTFVPNDMWTVLETCQLPS